ncbi:polysialyltransferase family glycosyltransferase [Muricauda sp. TY007]|uniref:polysialyltransferase family glycosyltransferase n=1 Tax=Allomuricauda sp. TY007 TaxID=2683200 RepID=UPI0027D2F1C0|nr:polysialyltransferase family glycosyltransferase [Muricauda sp. TY007]
MSNTEQHVFVSIAPSHNKNFEQIIAAKGLSGIKILVNAGHYPFDEKFWSIVVAGDPMPMRNPSNRGIIKNVKFQVLKIKSYRSTLDTLKRRVPNSQWELYYCNLEDVLNNYLFFRFRKKTLIKRTLVEDGILNYYDYRITRERRRTFQLKKWVAYFFGMPYNILNGQLSGIDLPEVPDQYVKFPEFALYPEKAIPLGYNEIKYVADKTKVLFIGQDVLENVLGHAEYRNLVSSMIQQIQKLTSTENTIYYKPHRNGNYHVAFGLLKENFGNRVELIQDKSPVEDIVDEIRACKIFSFFSTALVNIQMGLDKEQNVLVYSMPFGQVDKKVLKLFEHVGIKILE